MRDGRLVAELHETDISQDSIINAMAHGENA
jgi:ABC-type sugar transport system ATPase subunit